MGCVVPYRGTGWGFFMFFVKKILLAGIFLLFVRLQAQFFIGVAWFFRRCDKLLTALRRDKRGRYLEKYNWLLITDDYLGEHTRWESTKIVFVSTISGKESTLSVIRVNLFSTIIKKINWLLMSDDFTFTIIDTTISATYAGMHSSRKSSIISNQ